MEPPYISADAIRTTLDDLLNTTTRRGRSPLDALTLVDEFLSDPSLPRMENSRVFAINSILLNLITQEFKEQRRIHRLSTLEDNATRQQHIETIKQDAIVNSPNLIAWSLLYYHYVEVDVDISLELFADCVSVDPRTIRRRLIYALETLTNKVIEAEWNIRKKIQRQLLLANLPTMQKTLLFGREYAFEEMQKLFESDLPKHILVTGATGNGKTVFVQEFLRQQIMGGAKKPIEALVWLKSPGSLQEIESQIRSRLLTKENQLKLQQYFLHYTTIIVIDDPATMKMNEWDHLLGLLSAATVFVIHETHIALTKPIVTLKMRELDEAETFAYLDSLPYIADTGVDLANQLHLIRELVGGNPLALRLTYESLLNDANPFTVRTTITDIFSHLFVNQTEQAKQAWVTMLLLPAEGFDLNWCYRVWPELSHHGITALTKQHIMVMTDEHQAVLQSVARTIAIEYVRKDQDLQSFLQTQLSLLIAFIEHAPHEGISVMEWLLYTEYPDLPYEVGVAWIRYLIPLQKNNYGRWLTILEKTKNRTELDFQIEYGSVLWRTHRWQAAQQVLEHTIFEAGKSGRFEQQARAMLELATLFRYWNALDKANALLQSALDIAQRFKDNTLERHIALEFAQIALQQRDGTLALEYLTNTTPSPKGWMLTAEAYLLLEKPSEALAAADKTRRFFENDKLNLALNQMITGRAYMQKNNDELALDFMLRAITLLETLQYPLVLARAWVNYAVLLSKRESYEKAYEFLLKAEKVQTELHDVYGLALTRHNRAIVNMDR
ncbi:MAG: tetratricopeptide repeat protein [Anaerolineae bacterium]|nr:tetratricopeptide repeat protein [Anaerolineae bacterium]